MPAKEKTPQLCGGNCGVFAAQAFCDLWTSNRLNFPDAEPGGLFGGFTGHANFHVASRCRSESNLLKGLLIDYLAATFKNRAEFCAIANFNFERAGEHVAIFHHEAKLAHLVIRAEV